MTPEKLEMLLRYGQQTRTEQNIPYMKLTQKKKQHHAERYLAGKRVPLEIKSAPAFKAFCTKMQRGAL